MLYYIDTNIIWKRQWNLSDPMIKKLQDHIKRMICSDGLRLNATLRVFKLEHEMFHLLAMIIESQSPIQ